MKASLGGSNRAVRDYDRVSTDQYFELYWDCLLYTSKTTIPFHQRVLKNAAFLKGEYDTTFIDTRFDKEDLKRRQNTCLLYTSRCV